MNSNLQNALERFPELLFGIEDPLKDFKKGLYEPSFRKYIEKNQEIFEIIEEVYTSSEEPEAVIESLSKEFVKKAYETIASLSKLKTEEHMLKYNMSIVIYVNPSLIECNKESGRLLAETIIKDWKETFPKTNLKVSEFQTINNGFAKRFCYITTAVCEQLGKPDDCYELTLLREYRDNYLQNTKEGRNMIQKYYDIAPTIVKHINRLDEKDEIYQDIYKTYLSPCISYIEEDKNEECYKLYYSMVETLKDKYFTN